MCPGPSTFAHNIRKLNGQGWVLGVMCPVILKLKRIFSVFCYNNLQVFVFVRRVDFLYESCRVDWHVPTATCARYCTVYLSVVETVLAHWSGMMEWTCLPHHVWDLAHFRTGGFMPDLFAGCFIWVLSIPFVVLRYARRRICAKRCSIDFDSAVAGNCL